ncbi:TPA: hypothetical protein SLD83_003102 [Legionella pneumophila]|uniref:hypothetical protein n=2 Tax=Legionella pneumophila TaxID=446 RepID=UPI000518E12A|nr:hypothetical protein [Legionella pneumophila]AOU49883.1 hypothetical protein A9E85_11720 [Legionella pneumophila]MCW8436073.1 hypothetical protein [Legionella pneumophila]MCW8468243.1 hypothetical protein [Legionella pneumophila]MCW8477914.1 hypothetical protein [Legionella pneumophila]MCZ4701769.1 hypothetical protein [Legionella pneumophila]
MIKFKSIGHKMRRILLITNSHGNLDVINQMVVKTMKDVERLRKPIQQVANFILEHMMETADFS